MKKYHIRYGKLDNQIIQSGIWVGSDLLDAAMGYFAAHQSFVLVRRAPVKELIVLSKLQVWELEYDTAPTPKMMNQWGQRGIMFTWSLIDSRPSKDPVCMDLTKDELGYSDIRYGINLDRFVQEYMYVREEHMYEYERKIFKTWKEENQVNI